MTRGTRDHRLPDRRGLPGVAGEYRHPTARRSTRTISRATRNGSGIR